jgi:formylglycine-generating enzyme required for sulfatase activity
MRFLFVAALCLCAYASDPVLVNWSVDTSGIEKISKTVSFDTLHIDSTHSSLDTITTTRWIGSLVFSCQDSTNDSMGVFIDVNAGIDTIPADSVWGVTTTFPGNNLKTFFSFHTVQKNWTGQIPMRVRLSLDNLLLGYNRKPKIISQPASLSSTRGQQCRFSVVAVADPAPTYSWIFNGNAIAGAHASDYVIASSDTGQAGKYWVVVSNSLGSVVSDTATLGVNVGAIIIAQPQSQNVTAGQSVSFAVTAVGIPSPSYQWRKNGTTISGAISAGLTIALAQASDTGAYSVVVSNGVKSDTSVAAILTVNFGPIFLLQPQPLTVVAGQAASFNVTVAAYPLPTYQWQKNGTGISGATSAVFSIASAQKADSGVYTVVATNSQAGVTSTAAHLTVNFSPVITVQPQSIALTVGQSVLFSVTGDGYPPPTYQWRKNGATIAGATLATYGITSAQAPDTGAYSVVLTNTLGSDTSANAILALSFAPVILTQPLSHRARIGQSVTFVVKAAGNPAPTYQWKLNGVAVAGATDTLYAVRSAWVVDTGKYTVTLTNSVGSVVSDTATFGLDTASGLTTDSLIAITGGTFQMGQTGLAEPVHSVTLSQFKISNTLVTQREFKRVMGVAPSMITGDPSLPVENVTWFDAVLYCNHRSKLEGKDTVYSYSSSVGIPGNGDTSLGSLAMDETKNGYRLPNEAEYEFVCRAGTSQAYYWGRTYPPVSLADTAAIDSNAVWSHSSNGHTWPVGSRKSNPWGLYDAVGQVQQWQNDWDSAYVGTPQVDPIGPSSGTKRVVRGGSWSSYNDARDLQISARKGGYVPKERSSIIGFRVVVK